MRQWLYMAQPPQPPDTKRRRDLLHLQVTSTLLNEVRRVAELAGGRPHAIALRAVALGLAAVEQEVRDRARRVLAESEERTP